MKKRLANIIYNLISVIAIVVFCYSGYQLFTISKEYQEGEQEYEEIVEQVVSDDEEIERFKVDFAKLYEMNEDVVGWIRFEEPSIISYPIVHGTDNDEYLYRAFQGYDNTVGSIFVNAYNNPNFQDPCTIVYGHRMYNGTMFDQLGKYEDKKFWENIRIFTYIHRIIQK